jgi:hypothetical protein
MMIANIVCTPVRVKLLRIFISHFRISFISLDHRAQLTILSGPSYSDRYREDLYCIGVLLRFVYYVSSFVEFLV